MGSSPVNSAEFVTTRFAPSPTGRLHLGHALSAIRAHDFARARGGRFLLRIEDIDIGRSRPEHVAGIVEDLRWLGLDWDDLSYQSARLASYQAALDGLKARGLLYPCFCTRAEIAASLSAPPLPSRRLLPVLPVMVLARLLPKPFTALRPVSVRFSTCDPKVQSTEDLT